eukprot:6472562-Prymnesium_polylepis.1
MHCCDWAGGEWSAAIVHRAGVRSPPEACKAVPPLHRTASTAYHNRGSLRFLRVLPPRLVNECSPPWRLWRTYTPQPH